MKLWKGAAQLAVMQFLSWGIGTVSIRAAVQANVAATIMTDILLGSLQFFIFRKLAKDIDQNCFIPWIGYTAGGVLGAVYGIYFSVWMLGK